MSINPELAMPLVSVIIPTYNRPEYLKAAIASVLQQTCQDFEIIVSDDCSAENPQAIVESFNDDRIRFRRNSENLGVGWNTTYAFKEAIGKYVTSLNDDDWWHPDFLETLVTPLERDSTLVLAFCDHYSVNEQGDIDLIETEAQTKRWKRDQLQAGTHHPFWKIGLVDQSIYTASAAVMRREMVDWSKLHEAGVFWDYYIIYLACQSGGGAYYCPERLSYYRVHAASETVMSGGGRNIEAKIRKGKAAVFCYECLLKEEHLKDFRPYFQSQAAQSHTTLGIGLLQANQAGEARRCFVRSLQQQAFNLRTLVALCMSYASSPFR